MRQRPSGPDRLAVGRLALSPQDRRIGEPGLPADRRRHLIIGNMRLLPLIGSSERPNLGSGALRRNGFRALEDGPPSVRRSVGKRHNQVVWRSGRRRFAALPVRRRENDDARLGRGLVPAFRRQ